VKYEKLPNWCQVGGLFSHEFKDHGDGLHPPQALIFKNLRDSWSIRDGGRRDRGYPRRAGRSGRSSGRGFGGSSGSAKVDNWEKDTEDDMEEDPSDESKKRAP
jgi:hypothetical protein